MLTNQGATPGVREIASAFSQRTGHKVTVIQQTAFQIDERLASAYAVLLDDQGVVLARGIINSREHLESLFEAKKLGVASLQEYLEDRHRAA